jgi:hypothetical protein
MAGTDVQICSNPTLSSLKIRQILLDAPGPLVLAVSVGR